MNKRNLQLKRTLCSVLLVLLLSAVGMGKMLADQVVGDLKYEVVYTNEGPTAKVIGHKNGTAATGSLVIPSTVPLEFEYWDGEEWVTTTEIIAVTKIVYHAFAGCIGLGSLTIGNSVTTIEAEAFLGCSGFTGSLTIPNSVTTIGDYAFYGCSGFTGNLTIGNSVNRIGFRAFEGCSGLTSFNIPNSVRWIEGGAFYETGWYEQQPYETIMYVDSWCLGYKGWGPAGPLTINEGIRGIAGSAFENCSFFTGSLIIPNSVIMIGDLAFYNCTGFTGDLVIPNSVTEIGNRAFSNCTGLTGSLTIGNSVVDILHEAFFSCGFTGSLIIGNSVTMISARAFIGCFGFKSITSLAETPPIIEYGNDNATFYGWSNSTPVYVPCGFEEAYASTRSWSRSFSNYHGLCGGTVAVVAMPEEGGTVTGGGSFEAGEACTLTATANEGYFLAEWTQNGTRVSTNAEYTFYVANDVELVAHFSADGIIEFADANVKSICVSYWDTNGDGELSYAEAASVTSLGNYFQNNSVINSFDELQYFIGLSSIGYNAFSECSGLTSIVLPSSITWIGNFAFNGCCSLTGSITIPKSVTQIGYKAFYDCCGIDEIIMLSAAPSRLGGGNVFCATNPDFVIYVPYESLNAYKTANNWSDYEPYIKAMFTPNVSGYASSTSNDKWTFIALPLTNETDPATVLNLLSEDGGYDLYQFDQSAADEEWRNYKVDSFNLFNGRGYLYARAVDVNLVIGGDFNEDETKEVSLDYDAGKPFAGWNLVGNPFPAGAYINRSYYVMNATGSGIEPMAISFSIPVPVCTGVMVKAEATGESVTFSKTAPETQGQNNGSLQIAVAQANTRGASTSSAAILDKAVVSFNEGDELGKFVFNKDNAKLYIPQGNEEYAIAYAAKQGEMPLNFEATENGEYSISIKAENAEFDYLHLIDNLTGTDIDLLPLGKGGKEDSQPATYTFTAKTTDYASRFRLVFSVSGDAASDNGAPFAFISNGSIIVSDANADATLQIVDMTGHIIVSADVARNISTKGMAQGVYVLRLIKGDEVKTQRIVIE